MQQVATFLEQHGIAYRVVGSFASMAYGEPRFTNDIDILADVRTVTSPGEFDVWFAAPEGVILDKLLDYSEWFREAA